MADLTDVGDASTPIHPKDLPFGAPPVSVSRRLDLAPIFLFPVRNRLP
jgi:hypothetical protein